MYKKIKATPAQSAQIKEFCLHQIKTEYGYDYTPEWHKDLDSLSDDTSMYYPYERGSFYVMQVDGEIVASAGMRDLKYKPSNLELFQQEFDTTNVASLWRTYTRLDMRNKGLATQLLESIDEDITKYQYEYVYLHTSWNKPDSVKFWRNRGFEIFQEVDNEDKTVHMYKSL